MSDDDALRALYEVLYDGMVRKDRRLLESVLDEGFVLVHMTGMRQSRERFIASVLDGTFNYYSAKTEGFDASVSGDSATAVGRSRVEAAVFGGGRHVWRLELDLSCARTADGWRFTEADASTYRGGRGGRIRGS